MKKPRKFPERPWTQEDDAALRQLWAAPGISIAEMGAQIGERTRSAVAGRAMRLGLPRKRLGKLGAGRKPILVDHTIPRATVRMGAQRTGRRSKRTLDCDELLRSGVSLRGVMEQTGLALGTVEKRIQLINQERFAYSTDKSCPKFADDERCIDAVSALGGFPRIVTWMGRPALVGPDNRPWTGWGRG